MPIPDKNKLVKQAKRLHALLVPDWTFDGCLDYLTQMTGKQRQELWEDITHDLKSEQKRATR